MRIFETYKELQKAFDLPALDQGAYRVRPEACGVAGFVCDCCGALKTIGCGIGTGYGVHKGSTGHESMHCYRCCEEADKLAMLKLRAEGKAFYCYLAGDGRRVTAWPGGTLGHVRSLQKSHSGWHRGQIARFHVKDVHGNWWQGRGAGEGMCCTLRPMKKPTYANQEEAKCK